MLYKALRPLLFSLEAETAHHVALRAARCLSALPPVARWLRRNVARPADVPLERLGLTFPHRVGLAAGLDKNAVAPWAWWGFGFGFLELGTITPRPQAGNPRPRMFRIRQQSALVNRMGFNNDGAEAVAARLSKLRSRGAPPFPIAISVGKNATTPIEQAEDDYRSAARILAPLADLVSVNISSPNTPGLRSLQTPGQAARLVEAIREVCQGRPVLVKFAPELEGPELDAVVRACLDAGAAGFIATNTLSTRGRDDLPEGGLSGLPLKDIARERIAAIRRAAGDAALVVGCGGVDDAASAQTLLDAGADLVQLYTALVYKGPFLAAAISRGLRR
ncbi:MAG: quinone-dependent dihydroorotate dehydrogenase [Planctomyces sp.]|nr:quinone-dependent dihydroorotate dehydrogenase [Planctomyces sp.]